MSNIFAEYGQKLWLAVIVVDKYYYLELKTEAANEEFKAIDAGIRQIKIAYTKFKHWQGTHKVKVEG